MRGGWQRNFGVDFKGLPAVLALLALLSLLDESLCHLLTLEI